MGIVTDDDITKLPGYNCNLVGGGDCLGTSLPRYPILPADKSSACQHLPSGDSTSVAPFVELTSMPNKPLPPSSPPPSSSDVLVTCPENIALGREPTTTSVSRTSLVDEEEEAQSSRDEVDERSRFIRSSPEVTKPDRPRLHSTNSSSSRILPTTTSDTETATTTSSHLLPTADVCTPSSSPPSPPPSPLPTQASRGSGPGVNTLDAGSLQPAVLVVVPAEDKTGSSSSTKQPTTSTSTSSSSSGSVIADIPTIATNAVASCYHRPAAPPAGPSSPLTSSSAPTPSPPLQPLDSDSDGDDVEMSNGGCEACINIKSFAFFCCIFSMFSGALVSGYVSSVITTIEKRFEIGSSASGFIAASVEFGTLVAAIFISYFGSQSRIPAWIGYGACIQGIGACAFVLPHLLAETYSNGDAFAAQSRNVTERMCRPQGAHTSPASLGETAAGAIVAALRLPKPICNITGYTTHVVVLVLAQTLVGIGGSPLFTLGTTYIDDHVSKETAPIYIACLYSTAALGPVLGFGLGAIMLQYYVDVFTFDNRILNLTPADPQWVGAWWGGFVIIGLLLLLISIPFFGFPKKLRKERRKLKMKNKRMAEVKNCEKQTIQVNDQPSTTQDAKKYGSNLKDLPKSLWKLISNPIYLVTSLGICCEVSIVSGFILFLPKYLETQFALLKSTSNLLTGGIGIPGAVLGIMVGGYFLKRFDLKPIGAIKLTLLLNLSASIGFAMLLFLGCDNLNLAGATIPYNSNGTSLMISLPELNSSCNSNCKCDQNEINLICGIDGKSYFSPCYAGCTHINSRKEYTNCACIPHKTGGAEDKTGSNTSSPLITAVKTSHIGVGGVATVQAKDGPCNPEKCDTLTRFMIMLFVMTFLVASTQMPLLMTTLRSVSVEERAFSLGLQFVMLRIFAYIPSPIVFGAMIDSTCILWEKLCNGYGACLIYDIAHFRYKYIGYAACMKFVGGLFFCLVGYLIKRDERRNAKLQSANEDADQIQNLRVESWQADDKHADTSI